MKRRVLTSYGSVACVLFKRTTQNSPTFADTGCLVSATHTRVLSIKAWRSEIAPVADPAAWCLQALRSEIASRGRRRKPSRMSAFQNSGTAGSAILRDHACVAMTHMCLRQMPGSQGAGRHPKCMIVICINSFDLLGVAGSRRGTCVGIRTTPNASIVADPDCLVSATHMCVIPRQEKAPRQGSVERPSTCVGSRIQFGVSPVERKHHTAPKLQGSRVGGLGFRPQQAPTPAHFC